MAEANRISWLQNALDAPTEHDYVKLYEPLLPYAIIFGVEDSWRRIIGGLYDSFPAGSASQLIAVRGTLLGFDFTSDWGSDLSGTQQRQNFASDTWWESRPEFGSGVLSGCFREVRRTFSDWVDSVDAEGGTSERASGRGWSGGSGSSGWSSSSSSSSGSSGGGFSGGGIGGGGGGTW